MNNENTLLAIATHAVRLNTRRNTMSRAAMFISRGMTTTGVDLGFEVDREPVRGRAADATRVSGTRSDDVTP
ncbi:hypothetical protein CH370_22730 [Leptospira kmetyi]|nr:hypothetical protein CH370_22730 [Leptospira kmetyi]